MVKTTTRLVFSSLDSDPQPPKAVRASACISALVRENRTAHVGVGERVRGLERLLEKFRDYVGGRVPRQ